AGPPRFGLVVVVLKVLMRDRPVEQRRPVEVAVRGAGLELGVREARRGPGPVRRRAADGLDRPCREVREVPGNAEGARRRARVEPRHLVEGLPLVVDVIATGEVRAGLEHDGADALLAELVGDRATAGARADDHDAVALVLVD